MKSRTLRTALALATLGVLATTLASLLAAPVQAHAGIGTVDEGGYRALDSTGAGSGPTGKPLADWTNHDISGTGTVISTWTGGSGDDRYRTLTMPFTFRFYNGYTFGSGSYSQVGFNQNGYAELLPLTGSWGLTWGTTPFGALHNTADDANTLAVFWTDMAPGTGGNMYYKPVTGPSAFGYTDAYVGEWKDYTYWCGGSSGDVNMQIRFYKTSNVVEMEYKRVTDNSCVSDRGIGIQNHDRDDSSPGGDAGLNILYSTSVSSITSPKTIQYRPPGVMPTPTADAYTMDRDVTPTTFTATGDYGPLCSPGATKGVLCNDIGVGTVDPQAVYVAGSATPAGTTVVLDPTGAFTFTPPAGWCGYGGFDYKDQDSWATSAAVHVNVTVINCNKPPVAVDDAYTLPEDDAGFAPSTGVLANDNDPDAGPAAMTSVLVANPTKGTLTTTLSSAGLFTYKPGANYCGSDLFTYKAYDGPGAGAAYSNAANITLTITCSPDSPTATADAYTTPEDTALAVPNTCVGTTVGVKCNDADPDDVTGTSNRDAEAATVVASPLHGSVSAITGAAGAFTYTPASNYCGPDAFSYKLSDNGLPAQPDSGAVTVAITVTCVQDPPVGVNDAYSTVVDDPLSIPAGTGLLVNDNDPDAGDVLSIDGPSVTYTVIPGSPSSSLTVNADGSFAYTPAGGWTGTDTFTYKPRDGAGNLGGTTTVTISVVVPNPDLIAKSNTGARAFSAVEDTVASIAAPGVLDNDVIGHATPAWSLVLVADGTYGSVTLANDGSFVYTPTVADYNGADSFKYKIVQPGYGESNVALVQVNVASVNDPPVGLSQSYTCTNEDVSLVVAAASGLLVGASDAHGGAPSEGNTPLSVDSITTLPTKGTLSVNPSTGAFTYVPTADANGADSFQFRLRDALGTPLSPTYTASLCITAQPDNPIAVADVCSAYLNTGTVAHVARIAAPGVLANDRDPDQPNGDTFTVDTASVTTSGPGTFTWNADGSYTYTPDPSATSSYTATMTYRTIDSTGRLSAPATVTCSVRPNVPPVAIFAASPWSAIMGESVTFTDGSTDSDGTVVAWAWDFGDAAADTARSPYHTFATPGSYNVRLTVWDDIGDSGTTTHVVVVSYPPSPPATDSGGAGEAAPVAVAGDDVEAIEGDRVTLHGTYNGGTATTYTWVQVGGPAVTLANASTPDPSFTAPNTGADSEVLLTFALVVGNGHSNSLPDPVEVLVRTANRAPTADAGRAVQAFDGDTVTLDASGSRDLDGDRLTFRWSQVAGPATALSDPTVARPTVTVAAAPGTALIFSVEVSDGRTHSVDAVQVLVVAKPDAGAGFAATDAGDGTVVFVAEATGDSVAWNFGDGARSSDPAPTHTYAATGTYVVTLRVRTAEGDRTYSQEVAVVVPEAEPAKETPEATVASDGSSGLPWGWIGAGAAVLAGGGAVLAVILVRRKAT